MGFIRSFIKTGAKKMAYDYVHMIKDKAKVNKLKQRLKNKEEKRIQADSSHKEMTWEDYLEKRKALEFALQQTSYKKSIGWGKRFAIFMFGDMARQSPLSTKRLEHLARQSQVYDQIKQEIAELDYYVGVGKKPVAEGEKKAKKTTPSQLDKRVQKLNEQVETLKKQMPDQTKTVKKPTTTKVIDMEVKKQETVKQEAVKKEPTKKEAPQKTVTTTEVMQEKAAKPRQTRTKKVEQTANLALTDFTYQLPATEMKFDLDRKI